MAKNVYHHYGVYSSRYSAGLGNEIFSFSKIKIANHQFPGTVSFPKYRPKLHELPILFRLKSKKLYSLRILNARLRNRLLIIDSNIYFQTAERLQNWDYSAVLSDLIVQYPDKNHLLHCSRMAGGYLAIQSFRDSLRAMISEVSDPVRDSPSIAIHIRGAVDKKRRFFWSRAKDFLEPTDHLKYGEFNKETPISFYLEAIEFISRSEIFSEMIVEIVTNLDSNHRKIQELVRKLEEENFHYRIVNGNQLQCMKAIISSNLIIPSISSFSLLAIFLSDSKYLWPTFNLFYSKEVFSIWGYEEHQLERGPTELNRKFLENLKATGYERVRGLPFPPQENFNINTWFNHEDNLLNLDLIYYGVVPKVFD